MRDEAVQWIACPLDSFPSRLAWAKFLMRRGFLPSDLLLAQLAEFARLRHFQQAARREQPLPAKLRLVLGKSAVSRWFRIHVGINCGISYLIEITEQFLDQVWDRLWDEIWDHVWDASQDPCWDQIARLVWDRCWDQAVESVGIRAVSMSRIVGCAVQSSRHSIATSRPMSAVASTTILCPAGTCGR